MVPLIVVTALAVVVLFGVYEAWQEHRKHQEFLRRWRYVEEHFTPEMFAQLEKAMAVLVRDMDESLTPAVSRLMASMQRLAEAMNRNRLISSRDGTPVVIPMSLHRRG